MHALEPKTVCWHRMGVLEEICNADAMHLELMAKLLTQNASIARWLVNGIYTMP